jgi:hypothetical protein
LQTVCLGSRLFDIGPTGIFAAVETLCINGPHLHEIGLPGSTFGQSLDCGFGIAEGGFKNKELGARSQNSGEKQSKLSSYQLLAAD